MTTMMRLLLPAATAAALTLVSAISFSRAEEKPVEVRAGDLAISSAWARATPPGAQVGAAYLTVENRGNAAERLLGATSPAAQSVEAHQTVEENGVARMRPLDRASVPAGSRLEMRPGGTHMMLMGLAAPLKAGETVPLTLVFETAGAVTIELPVSAIGAAEPPQAHRGH